MIKKETVYSSLFDDLLTITVCEDENDPQYRKVKVDHMVNWWGSVESTIDQYKQILAELEAVKKMLDETNNK